MATITVETGVGSASSNSYVSTADFETYATDRGITLTGASDELLIKAMDYIESQQFKGNKNTQAQALQWPRSYVSLDGYTVATTTIPQLIIDALCEVAIAIDSGTNPLAIRDRATKREKVGDLEVEYMDGASDSAYLTAAHSKLNKLTKSAFMVTRG